MIDDLTLQYGPSPLFKNISYRFKTGIYVFCGPNGSGKSSLLRTLAGIDKPQKGEIWIDGYNINKNPKEAKNRIGYCPDKPQIYPFLKPREFLKWIHGIHKISNVDYTQSLIQSFGLEEFIEERFENLSLGTIKKFFITASLLHAPKFIIMDEPSHAIDAHSKDILINFLKRSSHYETIILSTHDMDLIDSLDCKLFHLSMGTKNNLNLANQPGAQWKSELSEN